MELHTIGIDLGKTVFHLVGLNLRGEVVVRKKFSRKQLLHFTANLKDRVDWYGSLRRITFSRSGTARTCGTNRIPGRPTASAIASASCHWLARSFDGIIVALSLPDHS
jgi:hypothetical protein